MTTTWDPTHAGAGVTLSGGNLTATITNNVSAQPGVRGTIARSTARRYFEVLNLLCDGAVVGIQDAAAASQFPGLTPISYGMSNTSSGGGNKLSNTGGGLVSAGYATSGADGDVIGVAWDTIAGSLEFFRGGASLGVAFASGITGSFYPAVGMGFGMGAAHTAQMSANFGSVAFAYTPPSGFIAWDAGTSPALLALF